MIGVNQVAGSFEEIILYVLAGVLIVICLGCIYAFFRAIFLFIFSKGDEKEIKSARSSIRYMILGLFFTIMLLFATPTLLKVMHVQGAQHYTAKNIFSTMGTIISKISGLGNVIKNSQIDNQYRGTLYQDIDSPSNGTVAGNDYYDAQSPSL